MGFQLSDVTLEVNDDTVAYEPNTLDYDEGKGETRVRAASTGGGGTELIFGQDVAEAISMVKFELPSTISNVELVRDWQENIGGNVILLSSQKAGVSFTRTVTQATVTNSPRLELNVDGTISVEMKGNPAV